MVEPIPLLWLPYPYLSRKRYSFTDLLTYSVFQWPASPTCGTFDLPESDSGFEIMILIHRFI